jgi:hypothetical protein
MHQRWEAGDVSGDATAVDLTRFSSRGSTRSMSHLSAFRGKRLGQSGLPFMHEATWLSAAREEEYNSAPLT